MISPLDFYNTNKNCSWTKEPIPSHLTSTVEKARWILNEANFGWIELDLEIDIKKWQDETQFAKYTKHRGDAHPGWSSCCLHGIDVDKTGAWTNYGYEKEEDVPYQWTSVSNLTATIKNFWTNIFPADRYRRVRFMKVESNGFVAPHSDMPGKLPGEAGMDMLDFGVPVNIAVIHPEDCYLTLEGFGVVPFQEGKAFIVNIRHNHSVINLSKHDRVHVIGHAYGYGSNKEKFAELLVRSYENTK